MDKRATWGSSLGFVLASAGAAAGLGNIWKFPTKVYTDGGGAYIILYVILVAVMGCSILLTEFAIGRAGGKNAVGSMRKVGRSWTFLGYMSLFTGFIVLCYYCVIGGWVLKYIMAYAFESGQLFADPVFFFFRFTSDPVAEGSYHLIFLAATAAPVLWGVQKGVEKLSVYLMPLLLILLAMIAVRSVTLPGSGPGTELLLTVDFSVIGPKEIMSVMGQAFFSLSIGMGVMITYGSYLKKEENLVKNTAIICGMDTAVALLAAFAIIPAVAASGIAPDESGGFLFVNLAGVFGNMSGGVFWAQLFYVLLLFAAITSSVSIMESIVACLSEEFGFKRGNAALLVFTAAFAVGTVYASNSQLLPLEYISDKLLMPVAGLLFCIVTGWFWGIDKAVLEIEQRGRTPFPLKRIWAFLIRFVCPAAIVIVLLGEWGIIRF